MKALYSFFILFTFFPLMFVLQSCEEVTDAAAAAGIIDTQLVGAWYDSTHKDGVEISSAGVLKHLMVDSVGKLSYANEEHYLGGKLTKATGGVLVAEEKYLENNVQVTRISTGHYTVTNGGMNLTVTIDSSNGQPLNETYQYLKKNIGDVVSGSNPGTGTGNVITFTMDGQSYTVSTVYAMLDGTALDVSGSSSAVPYFSFFVPRTLGTHAVDGDSTGLWLEVGSTTYTSDTGTLIISTINDKNTQGSFNIVVQEQFNSTNTKNITGAFSVTLP